jgi:uncharacterized protein YdeI (BOF family)
MDIIELNKLRTSNEAPYSHTEYTVWLHNKIIDKINNDLWVFRERESAEIKSSYVACNKIMSIPSLKRI